MHHMLEGSRVEKSGLASVDLTSADKKGATGSVTGVLSRLIARVAEKSGLLSPAKFESLISTEMTEYFNDHPAISPSSSKSENENIFDPKSEIAHIRHLSRAERLTTVPKFKKNVVAQSEALAMCRIYIERMIDFDPDTPVEKQLDVVAQFSSRYGFGEWNNIFRETLE